MDRKQPLPNRRRIALSLACGLAGAAGLAGLTPRALSAAVPAPPGAAPAAPIVAAWSRDDAAHLLRRAGFGGTPEQIDRLFAMGREGAVDYLLGGAAPAGGNAPFQAVALADFRPEAIPDGPGKGARAGKGAANGNGKGKGKGHLARLRRLARLGDAPPATPEAAQTPAPGNPQTKLTAANLKNMGRRAEAERLRDWWIERMLRTDRPLEEKMSLFWHGLFTSGLKEVKNPEWMAEQVELYHRQALGNYRSLTHAVIHGPAMLKYLNNDENVKGKPNENLARELMELFTMGEGNGYTEADIGQVARALTGLAPTGKKAGVARMREEQHDNGVKTVFGASGNYGPDQVVDLIFSRPQPARHLAKKLWEYFAYPNPADAELQPVVDALVRNNYELKPALRAIFASPAFYSDKAKFALIKSPTELAIETARNLGLPADEAEARKIDQHVKAMDQVLLQPPNVRGWVGGDNWITAATLYARYNTACAMVNGNLGGGGMKGMGKKRSDGAAGEDPAPEAAPAAAGAAAMPPPALAGGEGPGAVSPARLFPALPANPTAEQVVDAAVSRFLQRPLNPEKRSALLQTLNDAPIHLGTRESDKRVREMIGLLLSTPEYQVH